MGRLIDTSNIRVMPQYMQDVMGIAMIRCEDLSRILADAPTVEAIPKDQYENRLKADMVAILEDLRLDFQEAELAGVLDNKELIFADEVDDLVQQKINALKGDSDGD